MLILGIETSSPIGGISLLKDQEVIYEHVYGGDHTYCSRLIPDIELMFDRLNIGWKDLSAIAISKGPGSFTGLRIGFACAKAICVALNIPLIAIPTLDILSYEFEGIKKGVLAPILRAKKDFFYTAFYECQDGTIKRRSDYLCVSSRKLVELIKEFSFDEIYIFGDGIRSYPALQNDLQKYVKTFYILDTRFKNPRPSLLTLLAKQRFTENKFDDIFSALPLYIRPSDAEINASNKQLDIFKAE